MKHRIILTWYCIEAAYARIMRLFGFRKDSSIIPNGMYCYEIDEDKNKNVPRENGGYWIKTCKYHRSTNKTGGVACTYVGYFGFDLCLYDQCKICGKNKD